MSDQKTFKGYAVTGAFFRSVPEVTICITDAISYSAMTHMQIRKIGLSLKSLSIPPKSSRKRTLKSPFRMDSQCRRVCASDIYMISSGWGPVETPQVVGHEIAGVAVHVGSKVKGIKIGDRVGVGAQIGSCYDCKLCSSDNEQYCAKSINTYADRYPNGVRTQGGYSTGIIAKEQFVFPIPAGLTNAEACSMMCGGLTVFSPIVRNGAGPGKRVGVIGIGGLGHYTIMFAKALGAEVYAFTHSRHKEADIKKMGGDHIVVTEASFQEQHQRGLDLIVSTVNVSEGIKLSEYLSMLDMHGKFICVGAPDEPIQSVSPFSLIFNGCFGGSKIGSKKEVTIMLELAARKAIKPWIEELPMKDVSKAVKGVVENKVRYRYVLKDLAYEIA